MSAFEICGFALALAACAGLNCYLTALLLAVGFRLGWAGMEGFGPLAATGVMAVAGVLYLVEFLVDKVPRANAWWGVPHALVRPACGVLFVIFLLGLDAGGGLKAAAGVGAALVALGVHLGRTVVRRRLNRSPEPFANVVGSVLVDAAVVALFTSALRAPGAAGAVAVAAAAGGGALFWVRSRRRRGQEEAEETAEAEEITG